MYRNDFIYYLFPEAANICQKFTANYDALEDNLRANTIGLVTLDEMKEKRIDAINYRF